MNIYLYVKTHRVTGLKYLGKTENKDPFSYKGSGIYWTNHIKKHGYNVETEILRECSNYDEIKEWGIYYSKLWNVVESPDWANLKEECGDGWSRDDMIKQNQNLLKNGKHHFLGEQNPSKKLVREGKHHLLGKNKISVVDKNGNIHRIPTDKFDKEKFVTLASKEGRALLGKDQQRSYKGLINAIDINGNFVRVSKEIYYSELELPYEKRKFVNPNSKEGKNRRSDF
jgi:hypothetical protein